MEFATIMTTVAAAVTVIFTINSSLNKKFDDLRLDNKCLKNEIRKLDEKISKTELNLIERMSNVEGEMDSIRNMMNTLLTAFLGNNTGTTH